MVFYQTLNVGIPKKMQSHGHGFTLMAKEKDFSIPMFTEAYEQYGVHLDDGRIVVVEGVASQKDGETRLSVTNLKPIESAISQLTEEVTWLIDPDDSEM